MSNKAKSPCTAECPDRKVDCHVKGHCALWDEYMDKHLEEKRTIAKNRREYFSQMEQVKASVERTRKRYGRK